MRAELLDLARMREIYDTFLVHDFPAAEVKPFSAIGEMFARGVYFGYAFVQEDELLAYAFFVQSETTHTALLDYFAVVSAFRGQGVGSRALVLLREEIPFLDGIVLEVEDPERTADKDEILLRRRRIAFYERAGVHMTGAGAEVFGVPYAIMYLPLRSVLSDAAVFRELKALYATMFSPETLKTRVKAFRDRAGRGAK